VPAEPTDILPGIYATFATAILFVLVVALFFGSGTAARGTLVLGAAGSAALGHYSAIRGLSRPLRGALQFSRPWWWFTLWAAIGLYDGRYQPMVASAILAAGMSFCHLAGGAIAAWRRR
jgi:hypothetical protein